MPASPVGYNHFCFGDNKPVWNSNHQSKQHFANGYFFFLKTAWVWHRPSLLEGVGYQNEVQVPQPPWASFSADIKFSKFIDRLCPTSLSLLCSYVDWLTAPAPKITPLPVLWAFPFTHHNSLTFNFCTCSSFQTQSKCPRYLSLYLPQSWSNLAF